MSAGWIILKCICDRQKKKYKCFSSITVLCVCLYACVAFRTCSARKLSRHTATMVTRAYEVPRKQTHRGLSTCAANHLVVNLCRTKHTHTHKNTQTHACNTQYLWKWYIYTMIKTYKMYFMHNICSCYFDSTHHLLCEKHTHTHTRAINTNVPLKPFSCLSPSSCPI